MQKHTVLILGAGAGVDLSMPTGEDLTNQIATKVNIRFEGGTKKLSGDDAILEALRREARSKGTDVNMYLRAGRSIAQGIHYTRSIDSYIHTHRDNEYVKTCAKIAIVQTIIASERQSKIFIDQTRHPFDYRDRDGFLKSWLRELIYILQDGIIAKETLSNFANDFAIINFNYDRCVEHSFFRMLQELYLIDEQRAAEIMNSIKIFHPYGKVAALPWQDRSGIAFGGNPHTAELDLLALAKNIRTFNEEVEEGDELRQMRSELAKATNIVFLGFHFHKQNSEILRPSGNKDRRHLYGTVLHRSNSTINIIDRDLRHLFAPISSELSTDLINTDCKGLFVEFGETFKK
jgi:hypothetical protein